jgi:hypothetical protein
MAGSNNDFEAKGGFESMAHGEPPRVQEARAPESSREATLRIVHNADAQDGARDMEPRRPSQDAEMPGGMLDRNLQVKIGRMLRDIYSDVSEEPIPERFLKLLEALEAREKSR